MGDFFVEQDWVGVVAAEPVLDELFGFVSCRGAFAVQERADGAAQAFGYAFAPSSSPGGNETNKPK